MLYMVLSALILAALIAYEKRKSDKAIKNATERFWEKEQRANTTRRKDISSLPFISIPYEELPLSVLTESEEYAASVKKLRSLEGQRILDLSSMSNTELKLTYGAANLPELMECDQNYLILVRTLTRMASLLIDAKLYDEAETILQFSLQINSTLRSNFQQLATIYYEKGELHKLNAIIAQVETWNTPSKEALLSSLYRIKNQTPNSEINIDELLPPM